MTKTITIVLLCLALGVAIWLLIPRWDAHAQAEAYRTAAEQAIEERDQALAIADSMAEMSAAKAIHIHQMQQRLDAFIAAQPSTDQRIRDAQSAVHDVGVDSLRAILLRQPD